MTQRQTLIITVAAFVLLFPGAQAQETEEKEPPTIRLALYPDPVYTELQDVAEALANAMNYEMTFVKKAYADGRKDVIDGNAQGMLISRRMNRIRLKKARSKKGTINEQRLTEFIPLARKLIKSRGKVVDEVILGVAVEKKTPEINKLAAFARTDPGANALRKIPFMAPLE